jgi:hypothetical protein
MICGVWERRRRGVRKFGEVPRPIRMGYVLPQTINFNKINRALPYTKPVGVS